MVWLVAKRFTACRQSSPGLADETWSPLATERPGTPGPPAVAAAQVTELLRLLMVTDPVVARRFFAPALQIRLTGRRLMHDPTEAQLSTPCAGAGFASASLRPRPWPAARPTRPSACCPTQADSLAGRSPAGLNDRWRKHGERVGAWRCLDLFTTIARTGGGAAGDAP
jgi:hypothetical protein